MIPPTPRRKKWTEEEERTLIDKYGEMLHNGTLSKMKTREKKFRPIAAQVNSHHHSQDPITFPWQWSWKDTSTKVQNMRHQYLLVKQKIHKKPITSISTVDEILDHNNNNREEELAADDVDDEILDIEEEEFDWAEGLTHWPNFLRYKNVFGDVALGGFGTNSNSNNHSNNCVSNNELMIRGRSYLNRSVVDDSRFGNLGEDGFGVGIDDCVGGGENGVLGLGLGGFDFDGEEGDERIDNNGKENGGGGGGFEYEEGGYRSRKKRKKLKGNGKKIWGFLNDQFVKLREREARYEDREAERERERQRRERIRLEHEEERERRLMEREKERVDRERSRENMRRERIREWEAMENESIERERRRREDEMLMEREWEERMQRRRLDWKKRIDGMLNQHRIAMDQMQSRILHDQQTVTNQLLGILSHWTGHAHGLPDHTGSGNAYLSQMIHNLHPVNGIVHGENRVEADNQDDQYIVDG